MTPIFCLTPASYISYVAYCPVCVSIISRVPCSTQYVIQYYTYCITYCVKNHVLRRVSHIMPSVVCNLLFRRDTHDGVYEVMTPHSVRVLHHEQQPTITTNRCMRQRHIMSHNRPTSSLRDRGTRKSTGSPRYKKANAVVTANIHSDALSSKTTTPRQCRGATPLDWERVTG